MRGDSKGSAKGSAKETGQRADNAVSWKEVLATGEKNLSSQDFAKVKEIIGEIQNCKPKWPGRTAVIARLRPKKVSI